MKKIRRCILHIGSEKTGTTSIQHYFGKNRGAFLEQGVWYPKSLAPEDSYVHHRLSDYGRKPDENSGSILEKEFERECGKAARSGVSTFVISSEYLHSTIRTEAAVGRIRAFLAPHFDRITIVYYARRQDRLAVSLHSTSIRGGRATEPDALIVYKFKGHYYFDHLQICDLWSGAFGRENLVCRIFERDRLKGGDVIEDFCDVAGIVPDPRCRRTSANQSLSFETMYALLALNASEHRDNAAMRRKILSAGRKRRGARCPMLTQSRAEEFLKQFSSSNVEFFAKYVDPALAVGFGSDSHEFPETLPMMSEEQIRAFLFSAGVDEFGVPRDWWIRSGFETVD